jgi:UDP-N-acetyl-D-galactosamine dehydrogenase
MKKISVIGLGYVGLPLALMLSKNYKVIGYDINESRIESLSNNTDKNLQYSKKNLSSFKNIYYTTNDMHLNNSSFFIVTVPTPLIRNKPDLSLLKKATETVSKYLKKDGVVIYESTVYPGVTENFCGKILSRKSKLKYKKEFFLAYSPERINPGDKKRTIEKITKVIGASDNKTLNKVKKLYASFLGNNYYLAQSIKIAEAAKVIENSQRDINIAFMNEIKNIFSKDNLDVYEILKAARTKWNFLNFEPGLVGGHCIGIDPFYLAEYAKRLKVQPNIILAGRQTNENEVSNIFKEIKNQHKKFNSKSKVLVLGCTFKENCPDIRNSKVTDLIFKLQKNKFGVDVYDNWVNSEDKKILDFNFLEKLPSNKNYFYILIAVKHDIFTKLTLRHIKNMTKIKNCIINDYKNLLK